MKFERVLACFLAKLRLVHSFFFLFDYGNFFSYLNDSVLSTAIYMLHVTVNRLEFFFEVGWGCGLQRVIIDLTSRI